MRTAVLSRRRSRFPRRGTTAVEFAITCPIVFFLVFASIAGALGVFRYQQVGALAREGARWASVHGGQYSLDTDKPAATPADVYQQAIEPIMVGLDPSRLSYQVTWDKTNMPMYVDPTTSIPVGNTVTVTVTYQWFPELILAGPINLSSTSTAQMMY
jgi:Flp pilus assembly protein TadG